jgi:hypothetical protein
MSKFRSMMFTLLFALGLSFVNLFANVGFVAAAPQNPPKPVVSYESLQDEPVAGADAETATFKLHAVMMGSGDARLIMENVQGSGVLTGTLTTEGKAAFDFSVDLKNAPYPGVVIARAFAPKGQDVNWKVFYNGALILDQTSTPFKGVVHLWAELNPANPCEVNGFYQEDPGIDAQVDQQAPIHKWFSASKGSFGTFVVTTDGWHELKATAGRSKDLEADGTFSDKRGKLSYKWFANCGATQPEKAFIAHVEVDCAQNFQAVIDEQQNVQSVVWSVNGQIVQEPKGNLGDAQDAKISALVTYTDGTTATFDYTATRRSDCVSGEKGFVAHIDVDCAQNFQAVIDDQKNVQSVVWSVNGQIVQEPKGNLGDAQDAKISALVTYTDGTTATFDYTATRRSDCVSGRSRMWTTSFPILSCDALPQYNNDNVWVRGLMLVHINSENRPAGENWDIYNAQFSAEGRDASQLIDAGATRLVGIESRSITTTLDVAVIWNARQNSPDSPSTYGQTHRFDDTLVGVNPLNYNDVRAKGFNIPVPGKPGQYFGPAREGTKADAAYRWAYETNVNRCKPVEHTPEGQFISVCVGLKTDGTKDYQLFELGKEPQEAASCKDKEPAKKNFCAKIDGVDTDVTLDADKDIPVHLPCTLGEVDEAEANMIIFAQDMGALSAGILPLLGLVMLTGLLAIRRRYAH